MLSYTILAPFWLRNMFCSLLFFHGHHISLLCSPLPFLPHHLMDLHSLPAEVLTLIANYPS